MLKIYHDSENFPTGIVTNGSAELNVTWNDILWAAVTVGRPNRHYVFQYGNASMFEALFRWSLVRMSLEQSSPTAFRLRRTAAAKTLDPSEKGAINYFLGLIFCKLFASQLLNTPWLLHLDVFRPMLNPVLTGRSRPDMVGLNPASGEWHAFECKGRASSPSADAQTKAKAQASRLVSVSGIPCSLHIGAITYFRSDVLQFYWRDPTPDGQREIELSAIGDPWRYYYSPIAELISDRKAWDRLTDRRREKTSPFVVPVLEIEKLDVSIGIEPRIAQALSSKDWNNAHALSVKLSNELKVMGYQPDGIRIETGSSWLKRFNDPSTDFGLEEKIE